jgi:hypothetical protein
MPLHKAREEAGMGVRGVAGAVAAVLLRAEVDKERFASALL